MCSARETRLRLELSLVVIESPVRLQNTIDEVKISGKTKNRMSSASIPVANHANRRQRPFNIRKIISR